MLKLERIQESNASYLTAVGPDLTRYYRSVVKSVIREFAFIRNPVMWQIRPKQWRAPRIFPGHLHNPPIVMSGWDPTQLGITAIVDGALACQDPDNADALLYSICAAGEQLLASVGSRTSIPSAPRSTGKSCTRTATKRLVTSRICGTVAKHITGFRTNANSALFYTSGRMSERVLQLYQPIVLPGSCRRRNLENCFQAIF
jgi:hypothetical protein